MLVGRFRASYAHVFEPSTPPGGGEAKYQITMLIPKSDVNTYNAVVAEMNRALQEGLQKTFGGQMPARPSMPLYDGDGTKQNGEPWGERSAGAIGYCVHQAGPGLPWWISTSSQSLTQMHFIPAAMPGQPSIFIHTIQMVTAE